MRLLRKSRLRTVRTSSMPELDVYCWRTARVSACLMYNKRGRVIYHRRIRIYRLDLKLCVQYKLKVNILNKQKATQIWQSMFVILHCTVVNPRKLTKLDTHIINPNPNNIQCRNHLIIAQIVVRINNIEMTSYLSNYWVAFLFMSILYVYLFLS